MWTFFHLLNPIHGIDKGDADNGERTLIMGKGGEVCLRKISTGIQRRGSWNKEILGSLPLHHRLPFTNLRGLLLDGENSLIKWKVHSGGRKLRIFWTSYFPPSNNHLRRKSEKTVWFLRSQSWATFDIKICSSVATQRKCDSFRI